jgi:guanylate kinase
MKKDAVSPLVIGVVGPCGAGKSTLINGLFQHGIAARHIAQEHSYVPSMWKRITDPDILIFIDASYPETIRRRKLNWTLEEYQEQQHRLRNARQNADLYIFSDSLKVDVVVNLVIEYLRTKNPPD